MKRSAAGGMLLAMVATAGCGFEPLVSDTGYVGTWVRGRDEARSVIAIAQVGGEYRFRWNKRVEGGRIRIHCDWDGACEEWFDGKKVADYRFRVWMNPESGRLSLEGIEKRTVPTEFEQHYVDEMVVTNEGRGLSSYTVERNGETFAFGKGPTRSFDKLSDGIADPPRR